MSEKINVCFVSVNSYPLFDESCKEPFGGAELQVFLLAKYLARDDRFSVSVVVGNFGQRKIEHIQNVALIRAHSREGGIVDKLLAPFMIYRALTKAKPDLIIQRASGPETGICAAYAGIKNVKFIYSVAHDAELVGKSVASHHRVYRYLYEYGVKKADVIVLQSQSQMQSLIRLNESLSHKAVLISNSMGMEEILAGERKHILWIARAQSWKQPEIFIDLAKEIQDENFVMVMPYGEVTDEIGRLLKNMASIRNIQFFPRVDYCSSQEIFNNAKMLINTSSWEGFPNTFLQAGLASIPVVSLAVDPDSFIEKNNCGYVCDGSFGTLVEKVKFYLDNDAARVEAGLNCNEYVARNHDIQMNIEKWKNLISESDRHH